MKSSLGNKAVEPIGAPDMAHFRLVDMFTACTEKNVKDTIIHNFTQTDSPLCVAIATVAFGMGLDSPNIGDHQPILRATCKKRAERDGIAKNLRQSCTMLKLIYIHFIPKIARKDTA